MDVRAVVATVLSALGIQHLVLPLITQSSSIVYPVTEIAIVVGASIFFVQSAEYLWKKAPSRTGRIQAPAAIDAPTVRPPAESSNGENSSVAQLQEDFQSLKKAFENQQKQVAKSLAKLNGPTQQQQVPSQVPVNGKKNLSLGGASS